MNSVFTWLCTFKKTWEYSKLYSQMNDKLSASRTSTFEPCDWNNRKVFFMWDINEVKQGFFVTLEKYFFLWKCCETFFRKKQIVEVLLIEFGNGSSIFSYKPRYRVSCFLLMDASGNKFYFTVASCCRYDIIV
jgi:hypothetical protein